MAQGHKMSSQQLDELWHLDFKLAHELLGWPLRKCSAVPVTWGTPMESANFERLKLEVRRMWLKAAVHFTCFRNEDGWGLKVNELHEKKLCLSSKSEAILGWFVEVPSNIQCPSGHRYLRSLQGSEGQPLTSHTHDMEFHCMQEARQCKMRLQPPLHFGPQLLYLGGPISLANWSESPTVKGIPSTTCKPPAQFGCYMVTTKPLPAGTVITWNYLGTSKQNVLHPMYKWHLAECCTEGFLVKDGDPINKKAMGQVSKRLGVVQSYRLCTYCGLNLEKNPKSNNPTKMNMKPHIALHHSKQICIDQGLEFDTEEGVDHAEFFTQLHLVSRVLASIEAHNYLVMPACHFFRAMNCEVLRSDASDDEKAQCYSAFLDEAKEAFRKYRVLYMRGITVPSSYQDLLPVPKTSYKDVCWRGVNPPRSNKFAVADLLSPTDKDRFDLKVRICLENIVKAYSD